MIGRYNYQTNLRSVFRFGFFCDNLLGDNSSPATPGLPGGRGRLESPSAVAENQPTNKHRMNKALSSFAARLHGLIGQRPWAINPRQFPDLALELFTLQYEHNPAYRSLCQSRQQTPESVTEWTQIPFVPTGAFKELELSCLPPAARTTVFHSSGTTEQKPSRHFHGAESLALYEASLWRWFEFHFDGPQPCVFLSPNPAAAPHSSLVHMFDTVRQKTGGGEFFGRIAADGAWTLDFEGVTERLKSACLRAEPLNFLGTAFSFVHWLDFLAENHLQFKLPANSRVMETGGYKNRSRTMPKSELHALITERLGVAREHIVCEYGMSELSSQAYDEAEGRRFHFPPWAHVRVISPETGREVAEGATGLLRVLDLANVFSVAAIQTEDLARRRGEGFELLGRAQLAEPRGCSRMTA